MDRFDYIEEYKKWWNNLPEGEFTLILDKDFLGKDDFCYGWSSKMTRRIQEKKSEVIKDKHKVPNFSEPTWEFDTEYTYPYQCYTIIKSNSLKYSYNI